MGDGSWSAEPIPGMHILARPGHAVRIADSRLEILSLSIAATVSVSFRRTSNEQESHHASSIDSTNGRSRVSSSVFPTPPPIAASASAAKRFSQREPVQTLPSEASSAQLATSPSKAGQHLSAALLRVGSSSSGSSNTNASRSRPRSADIGSRAREALLDLGRAARDLRAPGRHLPNQHGFEPSSETGTDGRVNAAGSVQFGSLPDVGASELPPSSISRVRVRRVLRLRATTADSQQCSQTAQPRSLRMSVQSRLEFSDDPVQGPGAGQHSGLWARLGAPPCEFVADEEISSYEPGDIEEDEADHAQDSLFRLSLPREQALKRLHGSGGDQRELSESHSINLRVRLRLRNTKATPVSSARHDSGETTARRRTPSTSSRPSSTKSQLLYFVSAETSTHLVHMVDSSGNPSRTCASAQARPGWTVVPQDHFEQEREQDLDILWSLEQFGKTGKRACAFVEVDERADSTRVLAAFAFFVDLADAPMATSSAMPCYPIAMSPAPAPRALLHDPAEQPAKAPKSGRNPAVPFPSGDASSLEPGLKSLLVDHTEISVADCLEADSPSFRAAVQNLGRRTALLKKQAKTVLRATADVQAHASASRAAHAALDDALQDLSSSQPNTLGRLLQVALTQARTRARAQDESESSMLDNCVTGPTRNLLELCRAAQEHSKLFEADSRAYYNHTQKWLSTKTTSSGAAHVEADADVSYASSAVGYDKGQARQDRKDDLQKLRQLRFDRARVELYRVYAALHGGAAELQSAQQILLLCRWHIDTAPNAVGESRWPPHGVLSTLEAFGDEAFAAAQQANKNDQEAQEALSALDLQIAELEDSLAIGTHAPGDAPDASGSMTSEASKNAASTRFKSLLSSFGAITSVGVNQSVAAKGAALSVDEQLEKVIDHPSSTQMPIRNSSSQPTTAPSAVASTATNSSAPTANAIGLMRQKVTQKFGQANAGPAAAAIAGPVLGAFQRLRGVPNSNIATDELPPSASELSTSLPHSAPPHQGDIDPITAPAAPALTPVSPFAIETSPIGLGTPRGVKSTPRRALSQSNTPSPFASKQGLLDFRQRLVSSSSPGQIASARTVQRNSPSMNRSSSESANPRRGLDMPSSTARSTSASSGLGIGGVTLDESTVRVKPPSPLFNAAARLSQPTHIPAQAFTRKKEGLLWVHDRAINSASASDAPRGVNRSTHWREAWVVLSGSGHLGEYAAWREKKILEPSQPMIDLRFATVREARGVERRFSFEVVTRNQRRFFQAPDDAAMKSWMGAIRKAIESLIDGTSSVRQIDKVARSAGMSDVVDADSGVDDFGLSALRPFGASESGNALASQSKAFSQSLTDLSNIATNRLFNRQSDSFQRQAGPAPNSRHSLVSPQSPSSPYLSVLMEGSRSALPTTPTRPSHERGISNKTPVSGYVGSHEAGQETSIIVSPSQQLSAAGASRQSLLRRHPTDSSDASGLPWTSENEFDARIAELVQGSYGESTTDLSASVLGPTAMVAGSSAGSGASVSTSASKSKTTSQISSHRRASTELPSPSKRPGQVHVSMTMGNARLPSTTTQDAATTGNVRKRVERINSGQSSSKASRAAEIARISRLTENLTCADCRLPDPRWASWALNGQPCCIFICISCSGVHRSLGVHVSKVKSVDLDDWTEEQLDAARSWGNMRANSYFEANRPLSVAAPLGTSARTEKTFWKEKYVEKRWISALPREDFVRRSSAPKQTSTPSSASEDRVVRSPKRTSYPVRSSSHIQITSPASPRSATSHDSPLDTNATAGRLPPTPRASVPPKSPTIQQGIADVAHSHSKSTVSSSLGGTAAITAAGWSSTPDSTPSRDLACGATDSSTTARARRNHAPETPTRAHNRSRSSSHTSPPAPLALAS